MGGWGVWFCWVDGEGELPSPIDITGAATVTDPAVGDIYDWPDSATIAIFYDDLASPCHRRAWFGSAPWTAAWTRSPTPGTGSRFASTWPTARASDSRETRQHIVRPSDPR